MAKNDTMNRIYWTLLITSISFTACGEKLDSDSGSNTPEAKSLCAGSALAYYDANVKPLVQQTCLEQCHSAGNYHGTSFPLTTCAETSGSITKVINQIGNDRMPKNTPKLTTEQKAMFTTWKDMAP